MRKDDLVARIIGIVVFLGGVGLLAFSFATAYDWFTSPSAGLQITQPAPVTPTPPGGTAAAPAAPSAATQLGASALRLLIRLGVLLIMTIIGSLLAGRGAQIYFAASNPRTPAIYPDEE